MIDVPVSTVEKPLTAVDFCACLEQARSVDDVRDFAERVPMEIRQDDRFARAVQRRLAALKGMKAA